MTVPLIAQVAVPAVTAIGNMLTGSSAADAQQKQQAAQLAQQQQQFNASQAQSGGQFQQNYGLQQSAQNFGQATSAYNASQQQAQDVYNRANQNNTNPTRTAVLTALLNKLGLNGTQLGQQISQAAPVSQQANYGALQTAAAVPAGESATQGAQANQAAGAVTAKQQAAQALQAAIKAGGPAQGGSAGATAFFTAMRAYEALGGTPQTLAADAAGMAQAPAPTPGSATPPPAGGQKAGS